MRLIAGILLILLLSAGNLHAQAPAAQPLWEVGLFSGVLRLPHYRGSNEYHTYAMPLPYLVYRGERLQSDRDGVRGIFWRSPRFESNVSFYGNPPGSSDNKARADMPRLDGLFEAGPSLKWFLGAEPNPTNLYLMATTRAAWSVRFQDGLGLSHQGFTGGLHLIYHNFDLLADYQTSFGFNLALAVADRKFNRYFYHVPAQYATPERPSYDVSGGYAGSSVSTHALKKITPRISLGAYARWDNLDGAVFRDSPLVKTRNNYIVGGAVIITLFSSKTLVTHPLVPE